MNYVRTFINKNITAVKEFVSCGYVFEMNKQQQIANRTYTTFFILESYDGLTSFCFAV